MLDGLVSTHWCFFYLFHIIVVSHDCQGKYHFLVANGQAQGHSALFNYDGCRDDNDKKV